MLRAFDGLGGDVPLEWSDQPYDAVLAFDGLEAVASRFEHHVAWSAQSPSSAKTIALVRSSLFSP
ncbi:MAG TPA: hypothetical protein VGB18_07580 [Candidatus Thermoplasmatota archaeon]